MILINKMSKPNATRESFEIQEKVGPVLSLPISKSPPRFPAGHLQKLVVGGARVTGLQNN